MKKLLENFPVKDAEELFIEEAERLIKYTPTYPFAG